LKNSVALLDPLVDAGFMGEEIFDSLDTNGLPFDFEDTHGEVEQVVRELYGVLDQQSQSTRRLACILIELCIRVDNIEKGVESDTDDEE
jgi:hypothetical protein